MARRPLAAVALIACAIAAAPIARAEATLDSATGDGSLAESDHQLTVRMAGTVALVESVQTIVNRGKRAREAIYTFDLPGDAAVTDLTVRLADGRVATATAVDANAAIRLGSDDQVIDAEPDIGLLRLVQRREADPFSGAPAVATYELRVWPVEAGRAVIVSTSWVVPLRYDDGRLSLRVPSRGAGGALVQEDVRLEITPPKGARGVTAVHGSGVLLPTRGKGTRHRFTAPADGDLVVEYAPDFGARASRALVSFATAPVDAERGVVAVSVLAPPPAPSELPTYERVIVVVDTSRSMGRGGLEAARTMIDAVLDAAGAAAELEVIAFDRAAHRLFGELGANDRTRRARLAQALREAPLANGSDLGLALDEVRAIFAALPADGTATRDGVARGLGPTTLIAIVSDGMTPLALTDERAADRIGARALAEAEVLAVTIVPDDAPTPDSTAGPLGHLTRKTGGRSITVWASGAERRAAQLNAELARPPSIEIPAIEVAGATVLEGVALPAKIDPGRGATVIGTYRGRAPKRLALDATIKGEQIKVVGKRAASTTADAALRLWVASVELEELVPSADRLEQRAQDVSRYDDKTLARASRALLAIAARGPAVGRFTALIATDPRDQFSKERFAFAEKWGPSLFFRVPPPPERRSGHVMRELRTVAATGGADHPGWRPTGELDFDIVARLMRTFVLPRAQVCYQRALRKQPRLAGTVTIVVEIARGEVQHAEIARSTLSGGDVDDCVLEAAYSIRVPRVALGDDAEYIGVARYPITFRRVGDKAEVERGAEPRSTADKDDPLGGIPAE